MSMTTLGERLTRVREALGFTQAEFARKVGIKQSSMNQLESGDSGELRGRTLYRMILAGANPDYVMEGRHPVLLPDHERQAAAKALFSEYEGMTSENQIALLEIARTLRRTQPGDGTQ